MSTPERRNNEARPFAKEAGPRLQDALEEWLAAWSEHERAMLAKVIDDAEARWRGRELYTSAELAEEWRVSRDTIDRLVRAGKLKAIHLGNRRRIRRIDAEHYIETLAAKIPPAAGAVAAATVVCGACHALAMGFGFVAASIAG